MLCPDKTCPIQDICQIKDVAQNCSIIHSYEWLQECLAITQKERSHDKETENSCSKDSSRN